MLFGGAVEDNKNINRQVCYLGDPYIAFQKSAVTLLNTLKWYYTAERQRDTEKTVK